jgi:acetyl-CoA decarbonylase/synthase complex subunit gamma
MVVVDTEGLSVATSMAGGKLNAEKVAEAIRESKVEGRVAHRTLILPGRAAKLRADVERLSGWRAIVGPRESAELRSFLKGWPFPS